MEKTNHKEISKPNVRLLALRALVEINREGAYANLVLQKYIRQHDISDLDRRFLTELVYGVVRRRNYLDAIIVFLTQKPLKKLSSMVVEILRLGVYQLLYMDKVPDSAAVNESVRLGKKLTRGLSGFINAVMRNVIRRREEIAIDELAKNETERLSFIYNQPLWLLEMWLTEYTAEEVADLCSWFNETPVLTARVNLRRISREACMAEMTAAGWDVKESLKMPEAIYIYHHTGKLEEARWVKDGLLTFMDEASMAVAHVVEPKANERIWDVCAAPGSKAMHMAVLGGDSVHITATDIHPHKITLLAENAQCLGLPQVEAALQDGRFLPDGWEASFDRVLVDAPCSGLGVLQKKLDMRWRKEAKLLQELPPLQLEILTNAARAVKEGGILVYSTCTLHKAENEEVIKAFLKARTDFVLEDAAAHLPFEAQGPMVTLWPPKMQTDGFFIARLRRSEHKE